jgi:hypothetical protein
VLTCSRVGLVIGSAALIALGLFLGTSGGLAITGLLTMLGGLVGLAVVAFERMRYHSEADEPVAPRMGSPGGEPAGQPLEPRFRPTGEVFIDPTTTRRMRVYLDPATGERRYRAEG